MDTDKIYAERIATEYAPKETMKIKQLKKLDQKAKLPANIFAYTFGITSALVLGVGMCLAMEIIASGTISIVLGIIVGILGILGISFNYLIYKKMLIKGKNKYGSDILRLAKEISEE